MTTITIHDDGTKKTSELVALLKKKHEVSSDWDDTELDKLFPAPTESTTRQFLDSVEPDPDNLGKSRDDMGETPIMTMREYILMWIQGDKKYDIKGVTWFSERLRGGRVAGGYWRGRRVGLEWSYAGDCCPDCGARSAIPSKLKSKKLNPSSDITELTLTIGGKKLIFVPKK